MRSINLKGISLKQCKSFSTESKDLGVNGSCMLPKGYLPIWWQYLSFVCAFTSLCISGFAITKHFLNYRKPFEQRLTVRIQLLVPIFSITCLAATLYPVESQLYLDPVREVYEAFVIYTFFSLLTLILGGEHRIIAEICLEHVPSTHAIPLLGKYLRKIDLSDPADFLMVKRGILQYVWFKPFYCLGSLLCLVADLPTLETILLVLYNLSVTWSLYNLAIFWKCLSNDLKPFNPWSKFLCVKLIIFASYWQGIVIQILNHMGKLKTDSSVDAGYIYQNGLLCVEMIGFAILHWVAFPWGKYTVEKMPLCGRFKYWTAVKDCFGCADLVWDFKSALMGPTYYNYRNFEPLAGSSQMARADSLSRMRRLNQGFRFESGGEHGHWVDYGSISASKAGKNRTESNEDSLYHWEDDIAKQGYIPSDPNYPIVSDVGNSHRYSTDIDRLRRDVLSRSDMV